MNNKGFSFIETILSLVLVAAILYGLSAIPIELVQLKNTVNERYNSDLKILKLKKVIDSEVLNGGIIYTPSDEGNAKVQIGKSIYKLKKRKEENSINRQYAINIQGIKEDVIYEHDLNSNTSVFYFLEESKKKIIYNNNFSSFDIDNEGGIVR